MDVCMYQCGRVFVVLEDSVLTGYFRTEQSPFVIYVVVQFYPWFKFYFLLF